MMPDSVAKMKIGALLVPPLVTTKSVVLLKSWPVGSPPGMLTTPRPGFLMSGVPLTSPV